jgi:hypothetical protein
MEQLQLPLSNLMAIEEFLIRQEGSPGLPRSGKAVCGAEANYLATVDCATAIPNLSSSP